MSSPQYQVFRVGDGSYRYLKYPLPKQQLQLLYPGRLMNNQMDFTGNNIPNEYPVELEHQRQVMNNLTQEALNTQEMISREKLGVHPVIPYGIVEPEAQIEDPQLKTLTLDETPMPFEYSPQRENYQNVNPRLNPNYQDTDDTPPSRTSQLIKSLVYPSKTKNYAYPIPKREVNEFVNQDEDKPYPPIIWWGSGTLLMIFLVGFLLAIIYKSKRR